MFGAHVRGACAAAKHRQFRYLCAAFQPRPPNSTHDCGSIFGYAKFMRIVAAFTRVQCNMNFFSSSRKIFAPL
jgi:hypothetical protein